MIRKLLSISMLLFCWLGSLGALEIKTEDGLVLKFSDETGNIEAINIDGEPLPLLGEWFPVRIREFKALEIKKNLVPNSGLEEGETEPVGWPVLAEGASRVTEANHTKGGKFCGKVSAPKGATQAMPGSSGHFQSAPIPVKPNTQYCLSAWGMVPEGSSGGNIFAVELDKDGKIIWRGKYHLQHGLNWHTAERGKWERRERGFVTSPDCRQIFIYANVWRGYGDFYFDDVELYEPLICEEVAVPPTPLEVCEDGTGWRQKISCSDAQLELDLKYLARPKYIRIDFTVQDVSKPMRERALQVQYILPVNAVGWTWHDDPRRSRPITKDTEKFQNIFTLSGVPISFYHFASITKGKIGLSLGVPMDCPRGQLFAYAPGFGYFSSVDIGLSPLTERIGEGRATFTVLIFKHDGEWGMRAAAKRYYEMFPEYFVKRTEHEGLWFYAVPVRPIPNPEDFGLTFYEGFIRKPEDRAYAREKGIYILPYTEPWGVRQPFPDVKEREQMPPYEERLAILKRWAEDKKSSARLQAGPRWEIAQAVLNSMPYDSEGKGYFRVDKYAFWSQWWMTNTDPNLPQPNRALTCKKYQIDIVIADADGIYLDSVSTWLGNYINYRKEHFRYADIPLVFDHSTARVGLLGMLSHCEFMNWLAARLHADGKLVHMNIFPYSYRFCAHLADILGSEVGSGGRRRNLTEVESDERALMRRTLAYQKSTSNLLQEGNFKNPVPELTQREVEQYIKHQMFYGFYPGIATIGGEEKAGYIGWKRYFGAPSQYERDRPLFNKYIPIIKELGKAGWEPVTYARTSSANVYIERFGSWEKGDLHLTIRNFGEKVEKFVVTVQLAKLGATQHKLDKVAAKELISGSVVPVKAKMETGCVEFSMSLPAKETAVVKLSAKKSEK